MTEVELRGDFLFRKPNHSDQLLKSLNTLRKDGLYTDFSLLADNNVIPCHKVVLASLIPYFNSMFSRYDCTVLEYKSIIYHFVQFEINIFTV